MALHFRFCCLYWQTWLAKPDDFPCTPVHSHTGRALMLKCHLKLVVLPGGGKKRLHFLFSAPPLLFPFPCQRLRFTSSTRIDRRFRLLVVVVVRSAALLRLEPICYHCVALQTKHKPALLSVDFTQSAHHMTPANGNRR